MKKDNLRRGESLDDRSRPVKTVVPNSLLPGMGMVANTSRFGVKVNALAAEGSPYPTRNGGTSIVSPGTTYVEIHGEEAGYGLSRFWSASRAASRHMRRHRGKQTPQ